MKKTLLLGAVVSGLVLLLLPTRSVADAVLRVNTPPLVSQGAGFVLDINISNVSDLFALQLDLTFNPAVVQLTNVLEEGFLPSGGSTLFVPGTIDNTVGDATLNADTLLGAVAGANGSGTLLEFQFSALSPGVSPFAISNVILLDSNLNSITNTITEGSITVTPGGAVPEPATLLLLVPGLFMLSMRKRDKRNTGTSSQLRV